MWLVFLFCSCLPSYFVEDKIQSSGKMAQGKMKVKAKLPPKAKTASVHRGSWNQQKTKVTKKKVKSHTIQQKLQQEVTKEIRKTIEDQARGAANKFGESTKMDRKKK